MWHGISLHSCFQRIGVLLLCSIVCISAQAAISKSDSAQICNDIEYAVKLKYRNIDSSIDVLNNALQRSQQLNFTYGIARTYTELGYTYNVLGELQQSKDYFNKAIAYAQQYPYDKTLLPRAYLDAARCYTNEGSYEIAADYLKKSWGEILRYNLEEILRGKLVFSFGLYCYNLKQYSTALAFFAESEKIALYKRDTTMAILSVLNQGEMYMAMEYWDKAYRDISRGERMAAKYGYLVSQQIALNNLGYIYTQRHQHKEAIASYGKAITLLKESHAHSLHLLSYYSLASAYYETHDYANAKKLLYSIVKRSQTTSIDNNLDMGYWLLANIASDEGRHQEAVQWFKSYIEFKNKIAKKQNILDFNKLKNMEREKQFVQNQLLISQKELQLKNKNILIGSSISLALILGIVLFGVYRSNRHKQNIQAKQIEILQTQHEILQKEQKIIALKAMMSGEERERTRIARELHDGILSQLLAVKLHFIGTLQNNIGQPLRTDSFKNTLDYIEDAARELRKTAHNIMPETILQGGLMAALNSYMQKIKQIPDLNITYLSYGDTVRLKHDIELTIYRIVQELLQNTLKHSRATYVILQVNWMDNMLSVTIEDNGIGCFTEETENPSKGLGLDNTRSRVELLNGHFDIVSKKNIGTTIYLEFELSTLKPN